MNSFNMFKNKFSISIVLLILLFFVVVGSVYVIAYRHGFKNGKINNDKSDNSSQTDSIQSILKSVSGTIRSIEGNTISVETTRKELKSFSINDKTKITKKTAELKPSDLKVGTQIVAFLNDDDETSQMATRIVVRDSVNN